MTLTADARRKLLMSADRMMADIDRITFVLPVGGLVAPLVAWCWADSPRWNAMFGVEFLAACDQLGSDAHAGLCPEHHAAKQSEEAA